MFIAFLINGCLYLLKSYALMAGVPAKHIGWMSQFGEKLDLPLQGDSTVACRHTGQKYHLQADTVTVVE